MTVPSAVLLPEDDDGDASRPMIMVTPTDAPKPMALCAGLGYNAFLIKLLNQREFARTPSNLGGYFSPVDPHPPA